MADEHDEWLDLETSERLLNGEPPRSSDDRVPDEGARLASLLAVLADSAVPAKEELPGEEAALAAFRTARAGRGVDVSPAVEVPVGAVRDVSVSQPDSSVGEFHRLDLDAGVVHIGAQPRRPVRARRVRWGRPVRMALAAAVAVGTLGGVAVAAGSGVLPGPFRQERPDPGASVSAAVTPGRSRLPSSPGPSGDTGPTPSASGSADPGDAPPEAAGGADQDTGRATEPGTGSRRPGTRWRAAVAACRDLRAGREPVAGRRRALEGFAGGSARVKTYCAAVLSSRRDGLPVVPVPGGVDTEGPLGHFGDGHRSDSPGGSDDGDSDSGSGSGDGHPRKDRDRTLHHHRNGLATPVPSAYVLPVAPSPADLPTGTPSPTFSTL
ncbi:hypothetical protein ACIQMP_29295 [Streptomyces sp. NPDC091385]|uniref:hypothetical protein n=1 Tax=Streptomyces sp. NPDC091385 TaxID=3365997 RepID=UPI00381A05C1